MSKESSFAFGEDGKENFKDRLEKLIGSRSVRGAAKDWGLPTSTLNNYLYKGTEPALRVVMTIAEAEGVSLEWLATGLNKDDYHAKNRPESEGSKSNAEQRLFELLSFLTDDEKQRLVEILARKGVETALYLLDEDNIRLSQLDKVMKAQILGAQSNAAAALNVNQSNVCDSNNEGNTAPDSLTRRA